MATETKLWHLENFNLFNGMPTSEIEKVAKMASMKMPGKDQHIYFPEDPSTTIYFLKKGKVKISSISESGRENIKSILNPGELFGELALSDEGVRTDSAIAMDDNVMICAISLEDMKGMMRANPKLGLRITKIIGFRLRKMERRLEGLIFKDARTRIVDFLKELAEENGEQVGTEIMVKHHLTHQDIANLTASSRQTVTTVLNELRSKNLIYFERKKFLIRNLEKLE
ncbi:MAG: Crp/Fnr family transcriptional regulator [Flavobacteriales bacterium]|nr:Crp/Fnr family transcriptional regulator [Flavobacteriales bacterium]MBL4735856.1 Crp/Fnr family transcriptional regulator [Flavobacteriales bacterium]